jgi:hypothetical protein
VEGNTIEVGYGLVNVGWWCSAYMVLASNCQTRDSSIAAELTQRIFPSRQTVSRRFGSLRAAFSHWLYVALLTLCRLYGRQRVGMGTWV